jgi:SusD family.
MLSTDSCATGRAPRAAAWMLLSRLYLNAEVYHAGDHNDSCMLYAQKVINEGGYALENNYGQLFNADNDKRVGKGHEIIFPFMFSNVSTVSWGGATYLICGEGDTGNSAVGDSVGCSSVWSMFRIRGEVPALFGANDKRAMFYTTGQTRTLDKGITDRSGGYFVVKWSNKTDANTVAVTNVSADGAKTLFPVFRLADAYLMYAEAAARTNTNLSTALGYVNDLRSHRNASLVTESDLIATTEGIPYRFFLDERARELYWECVRRTDLIRFNCFTTSTYLWQWKGGAKDGQEVNAKYNIYPIPATEISANPNLYNTNY